ncbi:MAG: putative lipid II flippase FtsW [Candidatus Dependentiae bacterium]|nr:putative lipid II flippase FtsW [Candidatus Dependentiae bacterium]
MIKATQAQTYADLRILLSIIALLVILGSIFIYSSSSVYALERHGYAHYFLYRQLIGILVGLCALSIAALIPLKTIHKLTPFLFISSIGLTALSLVPQFASRIHGSSRWINIAHISFQPSELLKVGLLLYIAYFLDKKINTQQSILHSFLPLIIILAIPSIILLKQPDFGFTATLVSTVLAVCFIAQFQVTPLLISMTGLIPLVIGLIICYPYRMKRITTFLNPWQDPQGSGFQIIQSLIAIGSGGFWGVGIGQSRQKFFYLPMQHTDFIFSIIAEEIGFIGIFGLVLLYVFFLYYGLRLACAMKNQFSRFFILGFIIVISLQTIINMAVATGLAPTKGLGLPFISYGNTGLVTTLLMVGIVINMVKSEKNKRF